MSPTILREEYHTRLHQRKAEETAKWTAIGAAMATRGEPRTNVANIIKAMENPQRTKVRRLVLAGYDQARGNMPVPIREKKKPPRKLKHARRYYERKWRRKVLEGLEEDDQQWLIAQTAFAQRNTTTLIRRLKARTTPTLRSLYAPFGNIEPEPDEKARKLKPDKMSKISGREYAARIKALGLTWLWFGARNGMTWGVVHHICLQAIGGITVRDEMILDREELLKQLAELCDRGRMITRAQLYHVLRPRLERLP